MAVVMAVLVAGDSLLGIMSLFTTLAAMLIGGVGMVLFFDDFP